MADNKKAAALIVGMMKPKGAAPEEGDSDTAETGKLQAAQDIMQAIQESNADMLVQALSAFYDMCH